MRRLSNRAAAWSAVLAGMLAGCTGSAVVLDGAVALVEPGRVYVVSAEPLAGGPGQKVTIYQRVEQAAVDPPDPPWHLLKPVATGEVDQVTPQGAWVRITSGTVAPHGEIVLREGH